MPGPHHVSTLPQLLERAASDTAQGITFIGGPFLTYAELRECACRISQGLRDRGTAPGDRVLIAANDPELFFRAFWGCVLAGAVPCPFAPPADPSRLHAQLEHLRTLLGDPLVIVSKTGSRRPPRRRAADRDDRGAEPCRGRARSAPYARARRSRPADAHLRVHRIEQGGQAHPRQSAGGPGR
ncbi:AMP-binding protein [Streptomyces malaysiensis]|nr:AMP-binding protein [Streptomyces malaysiensis]